MRSADRGLDCPRSVLSWHLMDRRRRLPVEPGFRGIRQPSRSATGRGGVRIPSISAMNGRPFFWNGGKQRRYSKSSQVLTGRPRPIRPPSPTRTKSFSANGRSPTAATAWPRWPDGYSGTAVAVVKPHGPEVDALLERSDGSQTICAQMRRWADCLKWRACLVTAPDQRK